VSASLRRSEAATDLSWARSVLVNLTSSGWLRIAISFPFTELKYFQSQNNLKAQKRQQVMLALRARSHSSVKVQVYISITNNIIPYQPDIRKKSISSVEHRSLGVNPHR
jgi:hypothetical protein